MVQTASFHSHTRRHNSPVSHTTYVLKLMNTQTRLQDVQRAFQDSRKMNRMANNRLRFKVPGPTSEPCPCAPLMASISLPGEEMVEKGCKGYHGIEPSTATPFSVCTPYCAVTYYVTQVIGRVFPQEENV